MFRIPPNAGYFSQSINNNHLFDACFLVSEDYSVKQAKRKPPPPTQIYVLDEPSLEQLLYKLAIESAIKNDYSADLESLRRYKTFATFPGIGQDLLDMHIRDGIANSDSRKTAKRFVETNVIPLASRNMLIGTVLKPQFLSSYDQHTQEYILYLAHYFWFTKIWSESPTLEDQLACFELESSQYLLEHNPPVIFQTTFDFQSDFKSYPVQAFNDMVRNYKQNLVALKTIQKSGIRKKLKKSWDELHKRVFPKHLLPVNKVKTKSLR